jgi:uracil-DNA glycosylase family 4
MSDEQQREEDDRERDIEAAIGLATQALRGLVDDLALTGLDAMPRVKLSATPRLAPSRQERGPDAPDGRFRKDGREAPGPLPDAGRSEAELALAEALAQPVSAGERLNIIDERVIGDCRRCKLHRGRTQLVFGVGNPEADLVFVGEGPGAEEDRQGIPFVGRAGQLLDRMIGAMGRSRDDVYICNVVKCRPPNNRDPEPDEVDACEPFLKAQLSVLKPRVIVGLGRCASQTLLRTKRPIGRMRGNWMQYEGVDFMPTFHPSYLLRSPEKKREAWADLQLVMRRLGGDG